MGLNKKAAFRYRIIDSLLQNGYARTINEIRERVNEALCNEFGDEEGISKRTLYYDFETMRQPPPIGFNAPIECHQGFYQYSKKNFSIFAPALKEADKNLIAKAVSVLEQLEYIPIVRQLIALLKEISGADNQIIQGKNHIIFEQQRLSSGIEKMDIVQYAVDNKKPLSIIYLPFYEDLPLNMLLYPYIIKEYRNRWYVIGWEKRAGKIYNLAFDRIVSAETEDGPFIPPPDNFNPAAWFNDVVGVTIPEDLKPEKIVFKVLSDSAPYIRTKPIHHSQLLIEKLNDSSVIFSIEVIPNFELEMTLLGYGDNLEVIQPAWLREKIKRRLTKALNYYR